MLSNFECSSFHRNYFVKDMSFIHLSALFFNVSRISCSSVNWQGLLSKQYMWHSVLRTQTTTAVLEKYITLNVWAEIIAFCCLECGFNRKMNADNSALKPCCGKCSSLRTDLSHLAVALLVLLAFLVVVFYRQL